jgi:hypothetical protein
MSNGESLSQRLESLLEKLQSPTVSLREVLQILGDQSQVLLILLLALPFMSPIPVPILSAPFGLIIAWLGYRQALQKSPHLPDRLLRISVSVEVMKKVVQATTRILSFLERHSRPSLPFFCRSPAVQMFNWLLVAFAGLVLAIPIFIPFINGLPAWWIILLSVGLILQDGRYILAGYVLYVVGSIYLFLWLLLGAQALIWIKSWF